MMKDNVNDAVKSLIGEEAVRKPVWAHIVPQRKRDDVDWDADNYILQGWSKWWRHWTRHFWRRRNFWRNMAGTYKTSYMKLLHAWQTRKRCETCRFRIDTEADVAIRYVCDLADACAPNDFHDWEAIDDES